MDLGCHGGNAADKPVLPRVTMGLADAGPLVREFEADANAQQGESIQQDHDVSFASHWDTAKTILTETNPMA